MSIKFRPIPLHRALVSAVQAPNTAALSATYVPAVALTARLAAAQALQTSAGSRLTQTVVPAPTGVTVTALDDVSLRVTWTSAPPAGFVNYKVYRSTDQTTWTVAATVTVATAVLTGLSPYVNYYIYVTQTTTPPTVESAASAIAQQRTFAAWNPAVLLPATLTVPKNGYYDLAPHLTGVPNFITDDVALPSGLVISGPPTDSTWRVKDNGAAVASTSTPGNIFRINSTLQAQVPTLYVDAANPSAGNGTPGNPYKTIQAAINAATSGYTIEVAPGTYAEQVSITKNGLTLYAAGSVPGAWPANPITAAVITGSDTRTNCVLVTSVSDFTIDGFKLTRCRGSAIAIFGPNTVNPEIKNCFMDDTRCGGILAFGVPLGTDPLTANWRGIVGLKVHNNRISRSQNGAWGDGTSFDEHMSIGNGTYQYDIYHNDVGDSINGQNGYQQGASGGEGIDFKEGFENPVGYLSALGGPAGIHHNRVHDLMKNAIYIDAGRSRETSGFTRPGFCKNLHIYDNEVYNGRGHGIVITTESGDYSAMGTNGRRGGQIDDVFVNYNSVYGCSYVGILVYDYNALNNGLTPATVPLMNNVQVINNAAHGNNTLNNTSFTDIVNDHGWGTNIVYKKNVSSGPFGGVRNISGTPLLTGNINANPLFVNAATGDFTPQAGSPCVNAGGDAAINPTTDYANKVRTTPDIGAIER